MTAASPQPFIDVLVFGPQSRRVGRSRLHIAVDRFPVTPDDVMKRIAADYPDLGDSLAASRLAVNHEFASGETSIQSGDEVALIGMVSGG